MERPRAGAVLRLFAELADSERLTAVLRSDALPPDGRRGTGTNVALPAGEMATIKRRANIEPTVLDEDVLATILSRHFPGADDATVREAARDVLLLDLLARDIGVVWEDAMRESSEPLAPVTAFDYAHPRGS